MDTQELVIETENVLESQIAQRREDKFSRLLAESRFSMFILGNGATSDYTLAPARPLPEAVRRDFTKRGLTFVGILGVVDGQPRSALAVPLTDTTIARLSQEFIRRAMADKDAAEWLIAHFAAVAACVPAHAN